MFHSSFCIIKEFGKVVLPVIYPFHEIAPMVEINICEPHRLICELTVGYSIVNETDDEDDMECWIP